MKNQRQSALSYHKIDSQQQALNRKAQYQQQMNLKREEQKKSMLRFLMEKQKKLQYQQKVSDDQEFTCFICKEYFIKPITAKCGHSFCQYCIQQYFLFSKQCPICRQIIRGISYTYNSVLSKYSHNIFLLDQFIEKYISQSHKQYYAYYQQRNQKFKNWKLNQRLLPKYHAGMSLDVRDQNYVWCKGIVIRIISKVGDPIKFLKIQYHTQNDLKKQEQIKSNSQRLAPQGFFTKRKQIPSYRKYSVSPNKKK